MQDIKIFMFSLFDCAVLNIGKFTYIHADAFSIHLLTLTSVNVNECFVLMDMNYRLVY